MQSFALVRGESPGVLFLRFRRFVEDLTEQVNPDRIVHEALFVMPSFSATKIHFGLGAEVQAVCARRGIPPPILVNAMSLKNWVTGYGHARKGDMLSAVASRWKPGLGAEHVCGAKQCADPIHDEADAIALLHYAEEGPQFCLRFQIEAKRLLSVSVYDQIEQSARKE